MRKFWIFLAIFSVFWASVANATDERHWKFKKFENGRLVFKTNKRNFKCVLKDLKFISYTAKPECFDDPKKAKNLQEDYDKMIEQKLGKLQKYNVLVQGDGNEFRVCDLGETVAKNFIESGLAVSDRTDFDKESTKAREKNAGIFNKKILHITKCVLGENDGNIKDALKNE